MYVSKKTHVEDINFLKSQHFISFTHQADENTEGVVKGILPAGSIFPANDHTAVGVTINSVDVSKGPRPVGVIVEGHILRDRLPQPVTPEAERVLLQLEFYPKRPRVAPED